MGFLTWLFGNRGKPPPSSWLPAPPVIDRSAPPPRTTTEPGTSPKSHDRWKPSGNGQARRYSDTWDREWRSITPLAVRLAGEQHYKRAAIGFARGENCKVEIEREPDNPYDPNALKVIGLWSEGAAQRREQIGYVPAEVAAAIAAKRPRDLPIKAVPCRAFLKGNFVDLSVTILEPSAHSGWWSAAGVEVPDQI